MNRRSPGGDAVIDYWPAPRTMEREEIVDVKPRRKPLFGRRAHAAPTRRGQKNATPTLTSIDSPSQQQETTFMTQRPNAAPAVVRATSLGNSIRVEPLTCTIGAELSNVNLGAAAEDDLLMAEIRALLLKHRVVFFRDQDITRAQHVAFARRFGELEDHPVLGSDPDAPDWFRSTRPRTVLSNATRIPGIPMRPGAKSRHSAASCAASNARRWAATRCGSTWSRLTSNCPRISRRKSPHCARATASRRASAP